MRTPPSRSEFGSELRNLNGRVYNSAIPPSTNNSTPNT